MACNNLGLKIVLGDLTLVIFYIWRTPKGGGIRLVNLCCSFFIIGSKIPIGDLLLISIIYLYLLTYNSLF